MVALRFQLVQIPSGQYTLSVVILNQSVQFRRLSLSDDVKEFVASNGFTVASILAPEIRENALYIMGVDPVRRSSPRTFDSMREVQAWMAKADLALRELSASLLAST